MPETKNVAISQGYVWWDNRAAGWAIAVTQFPATPLQPMPTKQFQTFFLEIIVYCNLHN